MRLFSLSLTGTAFSWFSSLAPNSIGSWEQLEQKFHEHFFCGHDELKLSHLTSVRQLRDESVNDYIKRCFSVNIAEKDLADLAFNGLRSHIKERLEGYDFFTVTQVHQRALAIESRSKEPQESHRHHRSSVHTLECNSDCSDDESKDVYTTEFIWSSLATLVLLLSRFTRKYLMSCIRMYTLRCHIPYRWLRS